MSLPSITLSGGQLGKLFAATEKPNYDGVDRQGNPGTVAFNLARAIRRDAEAFIELLDNDELDPDLLVRDFLKRS